MPKWSNWSGKLTSRIEALHFIRNEEAACELARQCDAGGQKLRGQVHVRIPNDHRDVGEHGGITAERCDEQR